MATNIDFSNAKRGAAVPAPGKTRITIYLDDDVLETFRERAMTEGRGYQTSINEVLRSFIYKKDEATKDLSDRVVSAVRVGIRNEIEGLIKGLVAMPKQRKPLISRTMHASVPGPSGRFAAKKKAPTAGVRAAVAKAPVRSKTKTKPAKVSAR